MIRMGMIGCGNMARSFLSAIDQLSDRLSFTVMVDTDPKRARDAADSFSDARPETDYRVIMGEVDAVIIALPHDLHHQVTLDFLEAGKHVLLEKPMAMTERECIDLVEADDVCDQVLMIGYVMRFNPLWTKLGEFLRDQTFGEPFQVSIWTEQFTDRYRAWGGNAEKLGGGQLFSHGCHYIDLMLHWMGRPVEGSHLGTNYGTPWMEREGTSNVAIKFESDALGYHFGTWGARGSRHGYAVHAHCSEGMLELDHRAGKIWLHRDPGGGDLPALESLSLGNGQKDDPARHLLYETQEGGKATNREVTHFLDCIEEGRQPETNARMATQSLRVIWRLYEAEKQQNVADLRGLGLDEFTCDLVIGEG